MRASSFLLPLLLVVGQILSLTLASPLASDGMHKRFCQFLLCRVGGDDPNPNIAVGTWTPTPYQPSETAAASTPTPVKQQLGDNPTLNNTSVLEPSPSLPFESSKANAGVALASHAHEPGLAMALTGLFVIMIVF